MKFLKKEYYHELKSAFKYYLNAKTIYGIHSELLFNFLKSIHIHRLNPYQKSIEKTRGILLQNKFKIEITDLGAGSRTQNNQLTQEKEISQIARTSSSNLKKCLVLHNIVSYFKPEKILELGTNLGIGTAYIKSAHLSSKLTTIEACPQIYKIAKDNFSDWSLNINALNCSFDSYLENEKSTIKNFDFVFIDGNHTFQSTMNYFHSIYNPEKDIQVLIFDDIYWSSEMTKAWQKIKELNISGYSIDLFKIGIVIHKKSKPISQNINFIPWKYKPWSIGLNG